MYASRQTVTTKLDITEMVKAREPRTFVQYDCKKEEHKW